MHIPPELTALDFWKASRTLRGVAPDADTVEAAILTLIRLSTERRAPGVPSGIAERSIAMLRRLKLLETVGGERLLDSRQHAGGVS